MKLFLAIAVTFLITGPIGIVVGYKMAEAQQYQKGKAHGRADMLQQLHTDVRSHLPHRADKQRPTGDAWPKTLYVVEDKVIYVTEVNGVLTLATNP